MIMVILLKNMTTIHLYKARINGKSCGLADTSELKILNHAILNWTEGDTLEIFIPEGMWLKWK